MFWRMPGVLRSDSPHAFAAVGPRAAEITAPHPVDVPHGPDSPVGRALALDGQVLLIGVGHDANTTIHLAEILAGVRYRLPAHATVLRGNGFPELEQAALDSIKRAGQLPRFKGAPAGQEIAFMETWLFRHDDRFQIRSIAPVQATE